MTHPTDETLNDYIERELSPAEQVRVATHLETCRDCALSLPSFSTSCGRHRRLARSTPPPHVWTRIQAQIGGDGRSRSRQSIVQPVDSPESSSP